ncbi:MAG: tautomerase family protein [Acidimicrobiales bacterium]
MPLIEVKAVEGRLEKDGTTERLISALTDAACGVFGEESRGDIWVVVEGVSPSRFGVGGRPLG